MVGFLKSIWDDLKAFRRGETRVAPRGSRGHTHARKNEPLHRQPGSHIKSGGTGTAHIRPSRVYRAADDKWYAVDPSTGAVATSPLPQE